MRGIHGKYILLFTLLLCIFFIASLLGNIKDPPFTPDSWSYFELSYKIRMSHDKPRVLIMKDSLVNSFMFGAQTELKTFTDPRNLNYESLIRFIDKYAITHVATSDGFIICVLINDYGAELIDEEHFTYILRPLAL